MYKYRNFRFYHIHIYGRSCEIRTHGSISESLVFKTSAINRTLPSFDIWPRFLLFLLRWTRVPQISCNTTWHPGRDSNPDQQFWRLVCCHYTTEIYLVQATGLEPVRINRQILSLLRLPITPRLLVSCA